VKRRRERHTHKKRPWGLKEGVNLCTVLLLRDAINGETIPSAGIGSRSLAHGFPRIFFHYCKSQLFSLREGYVPLKSVNSIKDNINQLVELLGPGPNQPMSIDLTDP
jgi:hypothetical protein